MRKRQAQAQGTAAHRMSLFLPGDPKGTIDATPGSEQAPVLNRGLSFRLGSHLLACCGTGTAHRLCRFITSLRAPESQFILYAQPATLFRCAALHQ